MNVTIGTKNPAKVAIVTQVLAGYFPDAELNVQSADVNSGVSGSPEGEATKLGAENRAKATATSAAYGIGIESGLVERYGILFEEAWACITHAGNIYYGYSSGLPIPRHVMKTMEKNGLSHGAAMRKIREELNQFDDRDTWGTYSGKLVLRNISLQEALRNAVVQIVSSENNLYHL